MGCIFSAPGAKKESVIEKASHERRRTQHLIQNLVHEEYRLRVDQVRCDTKRRRWMDGSVDDQSMPWDPTVCACPLWCLDRSADPFPRPITSGFR